MTTPGTKVDLTLMREGTERTVSVVLGELREPSAGGPGRPGTPFLLEGLRVQRMSPGIARELGMRPDTTGVAVTGIEPGSAAAEAGLRRGDVIIEVNRRPVRTEAAVEEAIRKNDSTPAILLVNRAGETLCIVFE